MDNYLKPFQMTLLEAIQSRHSVRKYINSPLSKEAKDALEAKIREVNAMGGLHIQLICDEPKAFTGVFGYGKFSGVTNYLVMAGKKAKDLDERIGYTQMDMGIAKLHFEIGADRGIGWIDK